MREYVQLHGSYGSFAEVRSAVDQYDQKLRAFGSGLHLNAVHQQRSTPRGSRQGSRESRRGDRGRTSGRDRGDQGDRGGGKDRGRGKSSSPSPLKKPTGCWKCGDPNHLSRDCPKPMKCRNCGQEGHIAKDCPQPLRKASPEKEKKGKGKAKSKFRQVEEGGEPEKEAVEESTAGAGGETFMAVRSSSEGRAVETADLVSSRDSYRVESVRILKPPGDECFTWLVDSGATCHIVASRFLECYRVLRKHQGTTTLTGANGMPIPVQGICDLEVRIGKEKISLGSVVIADIDFNVLSCFSMQEQGWWTVLGAKNSYVVKGKMRFPIQMAERAWWMTVKSTRKDNGVKPMDVDRVGVMISAKDSTCAKVEMTKVAPVNAAAKLQAAKEAAAPKAGPLDLVESQARSLVLQGCFAMGGCRTRPSVASL